MKVILPPFPSVSLRPLPYCTWHEFLLCIVPLEYIYIYSIFASLDPSPSAIPQIPPGFEGNPKMDVKLCKNVTFSGALRDEVLKVVFWSSSHFRCPGGYHFLTFFEKQFFFNKTWDKRFWSTLPWFWSIFGLRVFPELLKNEKSSVRIFLFFFSVSKCRSKSFFVDLGVICCFLGVPGDRPKTEKKRVCY